MSAYFGGTGQLAVAASKGGFLGSVLSSVGMLAVLILLAMAAGRLLGIRLRWWRALAAGFPGLIIGTIFVWALSGRRRPPQALPVPAILFAALIAAMLIAVLLELLARPGRLVGVQGQLAGRGVPHPIRTVRRRAARASRYLQVTRIAARHGLAAYLAGQPRPDPTASTENSEDGTPEAAVRRRARRSLGRRLRAALEECGGIFVKLGQVLSTRSDLLPADITAELSGLQDDAAPVPAADIEAVLSAELGAPPAEVFAWFDPQPLAAASIAQTHRARLVSGEQVVVKIQRPGVRALIERDLDILLKLTRTLEARAAWAREYRVTNMARGFADALAEELDFRVEARNIAAVAGTAAIRVPAVHSSLSTRRVLVLEWLDGVSGREAGPVLARVGADRAALARGLLDCILRQVMIGGTFHADPHPGNVLVLGDGHLALIDFGSVGRLDALQQAALRRLLLAVARRNPTELHGALLELAEVRQTTGDALLERALGQFMAQHLGPGATPGASMFTALFALLLEFGITFPPVIGGVFRAMITLEGTLELLAPGFQMLDETRALAGSLLGELLEPSSLRQAATDEALALLPVLRRLPQRLDRITMSLEHGTLGGNVRLFADQRDANFVRGLINRAVMAFLGATLGIMSVVLLGIRGGPTLLPAAAPGSGTSVFQAFGYLGLFLGFVLILRVIIAIAREGIG